MNELLADGPAAAPDPRYLTLLAVGPAIPSHHALPGLSHDLADRLHQVVPFDDLILVLHDAATNTMRPHVLETSLPERNVLPPSYALEEGPSGWIWQHQQPLIVANFEAETRWQWLRRQLKRVVQSLCGLPLTTARSRLGVLVFTSAAAGTYHSADVGFLRQVANQVAVAVENALAFQQIADLKRKL